MNCKPGDLALIIRSDFPENLGRIVRVVELYGFVDNYRDATVSRETWWVESQGDNLRVVRLKDNAPRLSAKCVVPDSCLRPIRPEPDLLPVPPIAVTA